MFHPLCGHSLQKGAKIIAIADLVICVLSITFRMIVFDFKEYPHHHHHESKDDVNNETIKSNTSSGDKAKTDLHDDAELKKFIMGYAMTLFIIGAVVALIIFIAYILLEVWLCRLLMGASKNRDGGACKLWFWVRLSITVFVFITSIFGMVTLRNDWEDWVLEPINVYRIYELIVINEFRKEIAATSCIVKLRV